MTHRAKPKKWKSFLPIKNHLENNFKRSFAKIATMLSFNKLYGNHLGELWFLLIDIQRKFNSYTYSWNKILFSNWHEKWRDKNILTLSNIQGHLEVIAITSWCRHRKIDRQYRYIKFRSIYKCGVFICAKVYESNHLERLF